ncbi:MAG: two-component system LytT family sensor kinase [Paraglaciecola sp.]|jgi:two-component system LytT family sensor kinase
MKKSIVTLLHIGFWGGYILLLLLFLGIYFKGDIPVDRLPEFGKIMLGAAITPAFISFYGFYLFLFPDYLQHKKTWVTFIYGIILAAFSMIFGFIILYLIYGRANDYTLDCFVPGIPIFGSIAIFSQIVALIIKGFITWFEELKLKEALQEKNYEMEMALVKSQLDPHFLFNTINNIDILILKNAERASDYLNKLSGIMRFMLFETKTEEILLAKEIEYIEKYIELQKIRTANSEYVNFVIKGQLNGQKIAPMVFIPFIENAFKHTNNKKLKGAIDIQILLKKETIELKCVNKFDAHRQSKVESNGLGNELIIKRLKLIYPDKHTLGINNENNQYSVHLTIQK